MEPAQPPLPTASNFPFQWSAGNQTSKLMFESDDGLSTPTTRQNAGTAAPAAPAPAGPAEPRPCATSPPTGGGSSLVGGGGSVRGATGTGVPAIRISAKVMVVFASDSDLRFSQGLAPNSVPNKTNAMLLNMAGSLLAGYPARVNHTA